MNNLKFEEVRKSIEEMLDSSQIEIKYVDKNFVYVINPWDTSKTEKIKREDFEKYCNEIIIANL